MWFWILLAMLYVLLGVCIYAVWREKVSSEKEDKGMYVPSIFCACVLLFFIIPMSIDIPSALGGGEKIYTDTFPEIINTYYTSHIFIGDQKFINLQKYNPEEYEQNERYCVSYTKLTKIVLNIEKSNGEQ